MRIVYPKTVNNPRAIPFFIAQSIACRRKFPGNPLGKTTVCPEDIMWIGIFCPNISYISNIQTKSPRSFYEKNPSFIPGGYRRSLALPPHVWNFFFSGGSVARFLSIFLRNGASACRSVAFDTFAMGKRRRRYAL
jgi:hypothetical protein